MRDWKHIDQYVTALLSDVYPQPEDAGHTALANKVIDHWMSRMTTCHSVLDVGCGTGFCQPMFEKWEVSYEGVCLGEDYIKAQELSRNVRKMDFNFLDYPENYVDMIFSRHSLEHSPMPVLTLFEWARVATNWLGIILPAPEWYGFRGQNHYSVMPMQQIKFLLDRAGWRVIWEEIDELRFEEKNPLSLRPHEYWIVSEKKRD